MKAAVVANRGDGEVFVSHILLTMPGRASDWEAKRLDVDEALAPGRFLRRDFPPPRITGTAEFLRGVDAAEFEKLVSRAAKGDSCVELAMFDAGDAFLSELTQMAGPRLNTFQVGGYLQYWGSSRDTPKQIPVIGTGVVRRDSRPECR